jgi:fatty-acyl-CoA synthase
MSVIERFIEANQHLKRRNPGCWSGSTFAEALLWAAEVHAHHLAVKHADRSLTFVELAERSLAFARGLMAAGVEPGEKVGLWMADSLEWLVARWAVPSIGAVLVPINTRFRDTEIEFVLKHSDTQTLIMGDGGRNVSYVNILRQIDADIDGHPQGDWQSTPLPGLRRVIGLSGAALPDSMATFGSIEENGHRLLRNADAVAQLQDRMHRVRS